VVSLLPPGAGDQGPKGPIREPLHPDERAGRVPGSAPPPSERGTVEPDHRGVGVFRLAAWGWGFTIAIALLVGIVIVIGYLRDDPGRNPAPAAYRQAVCAAAGELAAGTDALGAAVEAGDDPAARDDAAREVETRIGAANDALTDLPDWSPGRSLNELLGAQIITLTNGAGAFADDPVAVTVTEDLAAARTTDAEIAESLEGDRYGFDCGG
jgi:hypothetical protein